MEKVNSNEINNNTLAQNNEISKIQREEITNMKTGEVSNSVLTKMMNKSIGVLIENFLKIALSDFSSAKGILKIALSQKNTGIIRNKYEEEGVHVPPFMIASITRTCNLRCKGCYDREKSHSCLSELSEKQWADVFNQARELGMSFILLAGGEPLTKRNIIKECTKFPEIIFPMFTNGMLINDEWAEIFAESRNIIPVISIEGDKRLTDNRRGKGVSDKVSESFTLLKKKNIFFGTSITVTSENIDSILNDDFIKDYMDKGCRIFFFIEYIPFDASTENLVISDAQKAEISTRLKKFREKYKGIFLNFPGDEKSFGGCLAAGRGFIHINAAGAVEPCPFAPYSDVNINNMSLKEALKSPLLEKIRNLHGLLQENGGCTLFNNKETVERIVENTSIL